MKPSPEPLVVADLKLNPSSGNVTRAGKRVILSDKETLLLELLMRNENQIVTRSMIARAVWDSDTSECSNIIDVYITSLRQKVDGNRRPRLLHPVRGKGFCLSERPELREA